MYFFNYICILIIATILGTYFYNKTDYILVNYSQWNIQIPLWIFIILILCIICTLYILIISNTLIKKNNKQS